MLSFGFPPLASPKARVLVLGSLPGRRSIDSSEYYAHRAAWLADRAVMLWDVLAAATRSGSLDAAIADDAIPNNFRAFFHAHPEIQLICFNGAPAAKLHQRLVISSLSAPHRDLSNTSFRPPARHMPVRSSQTKCNAGPSCGRLKCESGVVRVCPQL